MSASGALHVLPLRLCLPYQAPERRKTWACGQTALRCFSQDLLIKLGSAQWAARRCTLFQKETNKTNQQKCYFGGFSLNGKAAETAANCEAMSHSHSDDK